MKIFGVLLLACLQFAAGLPGPQHDHDHESTTTTIAATTTGGTTSPSGGATPQGCKAIAGDASWPAASVWEAEFPTIELSHADDPGIKRPDYRFAAMSVEDVQKAVKFAAKHNIRLTILNSGHDFLGRNDAPSGLALDISGLNGISVLPSFTPTAEGAKSITPGQKANVIKPVEGTQAAVTIGTAVSGQELNDAIDPSGLFILHAGHGGVRVAGGWALTAGHAPLSSSFGLGADQILEYKVVTADGELKVANKVSNTDLFWALRGGGGGTFGVVVEATLKAYPTPKVTIINWWINATNPSNPGNGYWDAAAYFNSKLPELNKQGVQGYYYILADAMKGMFLTINDQAGAQKAQDQWAPILERMSQFPGMKKGESKAVEYESFKACYDARFGPLCPEGEAIPGHGHKLRKRHGGEVEPLGLVPMDSRLLAESHLKSPFLAAALKGAFPAGVKDGMLRGHVTGGGKVLTPDEDNAVLPAWRKAIVHLVVTGQALVRADSLRILAPDSGAYHNEASNLNLFWKNDFFGSKYARLSQIKTKYDPNGLFWASPGVNADLWEAKQGRLCKTTMGNDLLAPQLDNQNIATGGSGGTEDLLGAFPGTPEHETPLVLTCQAEGAETPEPTTPHDHPPATSSGAEPTTPHEHPETSATVAPTVVPTTSSHSHVHAASSAPAMPVASAQGPAPEAEEVASQEEPELASEAPAATQEVEEAPAPSVEAPEPSAEVPAPSVEAPEPSAEVPAPSVEAPEPSAEVPAPSVEAPEPSAEVPAPSVEAPEPSAEVPAPSVAVPVPSAEAPEQSPSATPEAPESEPEDKAQDYPLPFGFNAEPDLSLSTPSSTLGAQKTKIKYGPYIMGPMSMIQNLPQISIQKPCTNCYIIAQQAGLEYLDGRVANVDTGAWLHHMVYMTAALGKSDPVCALWPRRMYASGNERTATRINATPGYGLKVDANDNFLMVLELMNESESIMSVYITMLYEWVPASLAIGYREAFVVWLDVAGCGLSETPARTGIFELRSNAWRSTMNGVLLFASGHVHDGGTETEVYLNGRSVCKSPQLYGQKAGFNSTMNHDGHVEQRTHISTSGVCKNFGTIRVGDELQVVARYNTVLHPLNQGHDGQPHPIMGITRVHIGQT